MSGYTLAQKAKAVAAVVGSVVTGLLGILTANNVAVLDYELFGSSVTVGYVLTTLAAVATYVATFKVPNAPTEDGSEPVEGVADTH